MFHRYTLSNDAGRYRVVFATEAYMARCRNEHPDIWPALPFYPTVSVVFNVTPEQVSLWHPQSSTLQRKQPLPPTLQKPCPAAKIHTVAVDCMRSVLECPQV